MIFTKTDKVLLDRAARLMKDQAAIELQLHGPAWAATAEGKEAKKRYDRLLRDERDLRALGKRLEASAPTVEFPASGSAFQQHTPTAEQPLPDDGLHPGTALS